MSGAQGRLLSMRHGRHDCNWLIHRERYDISVVTAPVGWRTGSLTQMSVTALMVQMSCACALHSSLLRVLRHQRHSLRRSSMKEKIPSDLTALCGIFSTGR